MTARRIRKLMSPHGLVGGLAMFAAEALIVLSLATVAWLISLVVLALI